MKRYSEERFMTILWDVYTKTNNGLKMHGYKEFCKSHNVTTVVFPILVRHKVLERTKVLGLGRGKSTYSYTWNTIQPNIYMAKKLMDEIIKINKEGNAKHQLKIKQQKLELQQQQGIFEQTEISEEEWKVIKMPSSEVNCIQIESEVSDAKEQKSDAQEEVQVKVQQEVIKEVQPISKPQRVISIAFGLILIKW
jgi:hypothetical protein